MDKILSPIKGRVLQFIEIKKITKESFFNSTGIARSNFSGPNAKSELGGDKIAKILNNYPEINPAWLILGEGEMLTTSIGHRQAGHHNQINNSPINIDTENQRLKEENEFLKARLQDKEEIINLLKTNKK